MNPFDLKTALLEKHAQHVVLIHFPIALFMASFAFDLLGLWRRDRTLATVAYYNLIAAAVAALPAVATGLLAWQWQYGGKKLRGEPPAASAPRRCLQWDDLAALLVAHPAAAKARAAADSGLSGSGTGCGRRCHVDRTRRWHSERGRNTPRLDFLTGNSKRQANCGRSSCHRIRSKHSWPKHLKK